MADSVSKERRSEIMSHIRSKDTGIELKVRKQLYSMGYRYRVNYKLLKGKPDIVFIKKRVAIFIHGCFWHGHETGCNYSHKPKSREEYWETKINNTQNRDRTNREILLSDGWKVKTVWECEIQTDFNNVIKKIVSALEK